MRREIPRRLLLLGERAKERALLDAHERTKALEGHNGRIEVRTPCIGISENDQMEEKQRSGRKTQARAAAAAAEGVRSPVRSSIVFYYYHAVI